MSYHPTIPQATDDPSDSQGDLLDNFGGLATQWALNHVALTAGGNFGMHTKLFFPQGLGFTADPNLTAPEASLYPKTATSNTTELFFQNTNLPTGVSQLTNLPIVNGIITNVIPGASNTITSPNHGLTSGNSITINGLYGSTQLNGITYVVTVINANTFTVVQGGVGAYVANTGFWTQTGNTRYGIRTPWGLIINFGSATTIGTTPVNYAIPLTVPAFTIQTTAKTGATLSAVTVSLTTGFTFVSGGNVYYVSIGA